MSLFGQASLPSEHPWDLAHVKASAAAVAITSSRVLPCELSIVSYGEGSGTVIDKKLGLVLSNRHVVGAQPAVSNASICNKRVGVSC
jgi:S1-C subfamily serine protease